MGGRHVRTERRAARWPLYRPAATRLPCLPCPALPCPPSQARIQNETNDAKNALEAYIYGLRNK